MDKIRILLRVAFTIIVVNCGVTTNIVAQSTTRLSYCDTTKTTVDFLTGTPIGVYYMACWGERFTLDASQGILDSVDFVVDSVVSDSIKVYICGSTLYNIGTRYAYLPAPFINNAPILAQTSIPKELVTPGKRVRLAVPKVQVDSQFFVVVLGYHSGHDLYQAKEESPYPLTPESTRAVFIAVDTTSFRWFVSTIDSNFFENGRPIYADFNFGATVETTDGVQHLQAAPQTKLLILPDPVTDERSLSIVNSGFLEATYSVFDAVGREVLSSAEFLLANAQKISIPINTLPNGTYNLQLRSKTGEIESGKFIICR